MQASPLRAASALRALLLSLLLLAPAGADEGLWLFNDFPADRVQSKYGFKVTPEFLDHIRLSSTRLYPYGSGSFVSPRGLVFTNHHVASDCIQKLTTAENNYMRDGFYASTDAEEKPCPDLEINVLTSITDVTRRVQRAVPAGAAPAAANEARKGEMSRIEKECMDGQADRCDVEAMFAGGQFHLYAYRKYTDIRLVFAPEDSIAAFGGDPDNFTYPRYCLDFALLRVYENGNPAVTPHYLRWSRNALRDGELTFVSGHPGTTGRLLTFAALEFLRATSYPLVLRRIAILEQALLDFSRQGEEQKRLARDELVSIQNSRKAYLGFQKGLNDPKLMATKEAEEKKLREAVNAKPELRRQFGRIWEEVARAHQRYASFYDAHYALEKAPESASRILEIARGILRYAAEREKPNERRLREYADSALPTLERSLFSPAPVHPSLERVTLGAYLRFLREALGAGHPVVRAALSGASPEQAAAAYVGSSELADVAVRQKLAASTEAASASEDGMLRLARILEGPAREARKRYEDEVEAVVRDSGAGIARARFAVFGASDYPDATFTLRLSYGPIKGYENDRGQAIPFSTRTSGLYARATGQEPFALPPSWLKAQDRMNPDTSFNFVTTNDTHGGNSGSPTINSSGEVIGILFDGNIESLPNRFVYTDVTSRSVHVSGEAIVEALEKIYRAGRILKELGLR